MDGPIGRAFEPPGTDWGPGHRGIDYLVPVGTAVAAAGRGRVSFAGPVAGIYAVTVDHGGGLLTTYSALSEISVRAGDNVDAGRWLGRTGATHAGGAAGLHFGVIVDGRYADPLVYLGPADLSGAIHLAPTVGWPNLDIPEFLRPSAHLAGTHEVPCRKDLEPGGVSMSSLPPPNDNIAVAIAGIGSKTKDGVGAEMYERGPELLGYPPDRVYRFSYAGIDGPGLHEPYDRTATFGDLVVAAAKLEQLLREIARRHPGVDVDLIAHSQGGVVARIYLEATADDRAGLPRVGHLVTFSTPHEGAPAAAAIEGLDDTLTGPYLLDGLSALARRGLIPLPDPRSIAAAQLATGSSLIDWLATEDLAYGTRALALAIPDDVVVPAHRALYDGELGRVVPPAFGWAHGDIVGSAAAQALAYRFLRDAPPSCTGGWDEWGTAAGWAVEWLTGRLPRWYRGLELGVVRRAVGL